MKQVIVVRSDIRMGKGKLAAQVAHASVSATEEAMKRNPGWYNRWKEEGQAKIVVRVGSEGELRQLLRKAEETRLPAALVQDRGLTQLDPGTTTSLGLGPAPDDLLDRLTGNLRLL